METHAFLAILEVELGDFDLAMLRDGFPIGLEIRTLKSRTTDLFGEETIFDRMIDVLQKLAVDAFVDGRDARSVSTARMATWESSGAMLARSGVEEMTRWRRQQLSG